MWCIQIHASYNDWFLRVFFPKATHQGGRHTTGCSPVVGLVLLPVTGLNALHWRRGRGRGSLGLKGLGSCGKHENKSREHLIPMCLYGRPVCMGDTSVPTHALHRYWWGHHILRVLYTYLVLSFVLASIINCQYCHFKVLSMKHSFTTSVTPFY